MIKEKEVLISVNYRNLKYYKAKGYDLKSSSSMWIDKISISIEDINRNSKCIITTICDNCASEKQLSIVKYWKNHDRQNWYSCQKCKHLKREKSCMNKYGVDSYSKTSEFKIKFKQTSLQNYGVEHPVKSEVVKDRMKETTIENHGVDSYFKTTEMRNANRIWMSSSLFKSKSKDSILEKYGVDSYSKTQEFKNYITKNKDIINTKIKETFLEKYGVEYFSKTDLYKELCKDKLNETILKTKQTCLHKYGFDNVAKVDLIKEKSKSTKIINGFSVPNELLTEWEIYKRNVRRITNRFKKRLYEVWDGMDYYDNELIEEYKSYKYTHRFYPTIDHKISIYYGFMNNISEEEIGNIDNLCITKRFINCMKNSNIEIYFTI